MEYRRLGQSDMEVSAVSFGCWQAGKDGWTDVDDGASVRAMRAAFDLGINLFDTAEVYGGGHSEEVVGRALEGIRDKVLIATKVGSHHLKADQVREALEGSLKRLKTDYIDLYQIHWPNADVPLAETMGELVVQQEAGRIRSIGVSNFNARQMAEASRYGRIDSLQPPYSLFWRHVEKDILPYCAANHIGVIAYSPLAQGLLAGKFSRETRPPEGDVRSRNVLFQGETYDKCLESVEEMRRIAAAHGKTVANVAINWLLARTAMSSAIVGARTPEQAQGNVDATGWSLTPEETGLLDKLGRQVMSLVDENNPVLWRW
ncbi:MAG: aldo/keto reductase [Armatimonadetes bacterium]|nr:aldo/keto reductase [Armatimonadota bacterium]